MKRPALISLRVILLAAAICLASNAAAAPTLITTTHLGYPSGQLIGVNGVELEGSLYDVRFQNGSCLLAGVCEPQALFQGPIVDGFPVGDDGQSMALAASVALRDQVFGSFLAIGDYYQLPGAHLPSLWARGLPGVFILTPFGHTDTQAMFLVEGPSGHQVSPAAP